MKSKVADIAQLWQRKRQDRRNTNITVNLAPMMDVMFNLLIFFLVATSFQLPEGLLAAKLPKTLGLSKQQVAIPVIPIKIFLDENQKNNNVLIRITSSMQTDATSLTILDNFDQLYLLLKNLKSKPGIDENTPVIIAAKNNTDWQVLVNAYNTAIRAKYKNIVFAAY